MLGTPEIIAIAAVVFLLFGATALPRIARSIGKAKREFERGLKERPQDEAGKVQDEPDASEERK